MIIPWKFRHITHSIFRKIQKENRISIVLPIYSLLSVPFFPRFSFIINTQFTNCLNKRLDMLINCNLQEFKSYIQTHTNSYAHTHTYAFTRSHTCAMRQRSFWDWWRENCYIAHFAQFYAILFIWLEWEKKKINAVSYWLLLALGIGIEIVCCSNWYAWLEIKMRIYKTIFFYSFFHSSRS